MMRILTLLLALFCFSAYGQYNKTQIAYEHIVKLKNSVVLVRLHTDEEVIKKMKSMHQDLLATKKTKEITTKNTETINAFNSIFEFAPVLFFYAVDSREIKERKFDGIFVNQALEKDSTIRFPDGKNFYVIDVGDIYFESFGGHFEGMIVMDETFTPLKKPFPYYVRKRSGVAILQRSDMEMAQIFQNHFEELFATATKKGY